MESKSAWNTVDHKEDFTELVAKAQKDMLNDKTSSNDVVEQKGEEIFEPRPSVEDLTIDEVYEWKWTYNYEKVHQMEEEERQWRIQNGVDPLLMGRLFRCQTELMHSHMGTSFLNNAKATWNGSILNIKESTKEKAQQITEGTRERANSFSEKMHGMYESASQYMGNLAESAKEIIHEIDVKSLEFSLSTNAKAEQIKGALSRSSQNLDQKSEEFAINTNRISSDVKENLSEVSHELSKDTRLIVDETKKIGGEIKLSAQEERERLRRINNKEDPSLTEKRHIIESDILSSVKLVN